MDISNINKEHWDWEIEIKVWGPGLWLLLGETHIIRYIDSLVVCLLLGVSTQSRYLATKCLLERKEDNDNNSELQTFRDTQ